MPRFNDLINDINSQLSDKEGEKGKWIKATKHTSFYNSKYPKHTDKKGFIWSAEVDAEYVKGNILIYKIGHYNWFVLPKFKIDFLKKYPNAVLK